MPMRAIPSNATPTASVAKPARKVTAVKIASSSEAPSAPPCRRRCPEACPRRPANGSVARALNAVMPRKRKLPLRSPASGPDWATAMPRMTQQLSTMPARSNGAPCSASRAGRLLIWDKSVPPGCRSCLRLRQTQKLPGHGTRATRTGRLGLRAVPLGNFAGSCGESTPTGCRGVAASPTGIPLGEIRRRPSRTTFEQVVVALGRRAPRGECATDDGKGGRLPWKRRYNRA